MWQHISVLTRLWRPLNFKIHNPTNCLTVQDASKTMCYWYCRSPHSFRGFTHLGCTHSSFCKYLDHPFPDIKLILKPLQCNVQGWIGADSSEAARAAINLLNIDYSAGPGPHSCNRLICSDTMRAAIWLCSDVRI